MKRTSRLSLKMRLLIPTIIVLAALIITLSVTLIFNQQRQLDKVGSSVLSTVGRTNKESADMFQQVQTRMADNLAKMTETVGSSLARSTQTALENEKVTIREDMESALAENAGSMAGLMAGVAPAAILANNYIDLISYTKSVVQNPVIIYALYLKPNGKPLTRSLDRKNDKIKEWLKSGQGKKKIDKVINASRNDPSVRLIEHPIELEGKVLGKVLLCVDNSITARKTEAMGLRFSTLIKNNTAEVRSILGEQTGKVTGETEKLLLEVCSNSEASATDLDDVIRKSLDKAQVSTYWTVTVVGGLGILVVGVILFILLSRVSNQIRSVVGDLNNVSGRVNKASDHISTSSQMLADGASDQAAAIEETSASLEEMSSMTQQNAENMGKTRQLVSETISTVDNANKSMIGLTKEMDEISEASQETQKIVKTIDEIAFQTNLLALNAAVEAARAGEAGAGFAVVADEVRNLAIRAAEAAQNTAQLIERTVTRIGEGEKLVSTTHQAFDEVEGATSKIDVLIDEMAQAAKEEARGVGQINSAVSDMDRVVQQNAANSEESASASAELSNEAERMDVYVKNLVAIVDGAGAKNLSAMNEERTFREPKPMEDRGWANDGYTLPAPKEEPRG